MNTYTKSFVTVKRIRLLCASILMLGASAVYAEPAVVISGDSCTLLDGNGQFFRTGVIKATQANNFPGGNIMVKCRAAEVPNLTGGSVHWDFDNLPMWILDYYGPDVKINCVSKVFDATTENWKVVVDSEGNAVMTCKFRN